MIRNLGLALTTALACTYSTGASAAELAVTEASTTEAAVEVSDSATYGVAEVGDSAAYRAIAGVDDSATYGVAAVSSLAATQSSSSSGSGWEFAITPYFWAAGVKADIETPQGEEINSDLSFGDILDALKFALMFSFDAKHGRFVSTQDFFLISLGDSADGHIGPIPLDADLDLKLRWTTHLFGYRVVDKGPMFVDLLAGGRFTMIKVDLDLDVLQQTFNRDSKKTEFGPVIGSRVRFPLGDKWGVGINGDIGGFGVGADLSWELIGNIQYDISDRWRLAAGWRHLYAKQTKNDFDVHIKLDGPILGVTYSF